MITREELLKSKEYWLAIIQHQLFAHLEAYMEEKKLTRSSLAQKLGVTKGYVTQVLNGDYDHRLSKYVELLLATGKVPVIKLEDVDTKAKENKVVMAAGVTVENDLGDNPKTVTIDLEKNPGALELLEKAGMIKLKKNPAKSKNYKFFEKDSTTNTLTGSQLIKKAKAKIDKWPHGK